MPADPQSGHTDDVSVPAPTPVVLVHGIRVSGASLHRIAAAIPDRQVVFPDLPGHGSRRDETFTLAGAVDTVVAAIETLGQPAVVAGMSMGGYVSMATAGRRPELVAGLVAMCSTAQPSRLLATPFRAFGAATAYLPEQAATMSRWLTRAAVGRQVSDDMEIGGLALASIKDVVAEVSRFDALGELAHYPGPIEFVNGGWDQFRVNERRFTAVSPNANLTVIPRASHLFPLIQPNVTGAAIAAFAASLVASEHESTRASRR
ncbi:pimeloyl-ACP methyl ester carboxylesterase [Williamsia limnetica]|uniref:Pimeloyl-ACP methyl ester carboxylesterase n=1 Tax=Williamsia limnetica TaxID=882452 RepID=A0A318RE15_WILLI|nr:pimeloyl-ACP methyl ester carboxylesterase [Williamsia limnetica]